MITNVTVNMKVVIPIEHCKESVESIVEKIAKDTIVDALHSVDENMDIWFRPSNKNK